MDIFEKLHDQYTKIALAGHELGDTYKEMIAEYQTKWDAGDRFDLSKVNMVNMMDPEAWKRDPADEESELTACIAELAGKVKTALLENWAKSYSREQVENIFQSLAALDWNGKVVVHGMEVNYYELSSAWNSTHAEEEGL